MHPFSSFPKDLLLSDFGYKLPDEKIARYPLEQRDMSKLLIWNAGRIEESTYQHLAEFLPSPCSLAFNNSRVVEARILFQKPSGGQIEIFCLEPHTSFLPVSLAMTRTGKVLWSCLIGGASKWKHGQVLVKQVGKIRLEARFINKRKDDFTVEFVWTPSDISFSEILHRFGSVPLPPYLKRSADISDSERYQTVYAKELGSVAAPTAGLHFTKKLLNTFSQKKILPLYFTLHVGAGTFMPVKTENLAEHQMHEEYIEVNEDMLSKLISRINDPVIAVGTTSLRILESLYWLGLKASHQPEISASELYLDQDFPYREPASIPVMDALQHLQKWIRISPDKKIFTKTQLFIVPGYSFKIVRGLITNFHQPHSTLLMLVAALIGPAWRSVYTWALEHDYRFLSYGDGCLFLP
jgi:S-adenosylmethionine:tRNA ribosyltransferase-isomerase